MAARITDKPPTETPTPQPATETATPEPACADGEYYDLLMQRCRRPEDETPQDEMPSPEATTDDGLRCEFVDRYGTIYQMPCPGGVFPYNPTYGPTPELPIQPTMAP